MKNAFPAYADPNTQQAMPLAADPEKSHFLARTRKQVKMKNAILTILYAEHSAPRRLRLAADLGRAGFLVRTAECAVDALVRVRRDDSRLRTA